MYLAQQNLHFLGQGRQLLDQLSDERFVAADCHGHASVGAHFRHVLDCYRCFFRDFDSGRIDYDARERNPRLESERQVALESIDRICRELEALPESSRDRRLEVKVDAAAWGELDAWNRSTVGRELQFLLSHTVHHYALVAMTLRCAGFEPDTSFGIAPSTLEHGGGILERQAGAR